MDNIDNSFSLIKRVTGREFRQTFAGILLFCSIILFPAAIRGRCFFAKLNRFSYVNWLGLAAIIILLLSQIKDNEKFTKFDRAIRNVLIVLWIIAAALIVVADFKWGPYVIILVLVNCFSPIFLMIYRMKKYRAKVFEGFLIAFDAFVVLLLVLGLIDKFSGYSVFNFLVNNLGLVDIARFAPGDDSGWRYTSAWGYALNNAVFFNAFFIINDCYHEITKKKYPKIIFFAIALLGVLLCSGKTAIVVLLLYFIVSAYRNKYVLFSSVAVAAVLFIAGAFSNIIGRFATTSLTSGRIESLKAYFESGNLPLRWVVGYGTGSSGYETVFAYRAGFEFPFLMHALDYGIIFSIIFNLSIMLFVSFKLLRSKKVVAWIGFMLIFAQLQTFNGMCLVNQDTCFMMGIIAMVMANLPEFE